MITAEEILSQYWDEEYNKAGVPTGRHTVSQDNAIRAMKEYASQFNPRDVSDREIKEACTHKVLPRIACWIQGAKWMRDKLTK